MHLYIYIYIYVYSKGGLYRGLLLGLLRGFVEFRECLVYIYIYGYEPFTLGIQGFGFQFLQMMDSSFWVIVAVGF